MAYLEHKITINKEFASNNILLEIDNRGVAYLILNRPNFHNALTNEMVLGINEALVFLETNNKIKILVLKSNGKSFCAGADLKGMQDMVNYDYEKNYHEALSLALVLEKLRNFNYPTIAVVQGNAYGGGVGLICCCDMAVANANVNFCLSEVKLGLIPAVISRYIVETIGLKAAKRYMLTAENFNATVALDFGMLSQIVVSDFDVNLEKSANQIINNLLQNSPEAMLKAKKLLNDLYSKKSHEIINYTVDAIAKIRISDEGQEGLKAFIAKRKPNWVLDSNDK